LVDGFNLTSNSTVDLITSSATYFDFDAVVSENQVVYEENSQFVIAARPLVSQGLSLVIVMMVDKTSTVGPSILIVVVAPVVGVALLILSVILVYILTRRITVPLKLVTKKLAAVSNLEVDPTQRIIETRSHIKEVNEIEDATITLIYGLRSFSKYVPPDIVKLLLKTQREATLGLDELEISIFFSDIANFTTISENLTPRELVALLGEYLMEMSDIVQSTGGLVDKYIGDSVMAFWNAPNPVQNHEWSACEAAITSQNRLRELRNIWVENGFPRVESRVGINAGRARVGNIGSSTRFNYTCIGDNVNLASRLEGLNKLYGTEIIVSGVVHDKVKDVLLTRLLDVVAVKGKSKAVRIYELIERKDRVPPEREEGCLLFKKAFETYLRRDFNEAIRLFSLYLQTYNLDDLAAHRHIKNCRAFLDSPPPASWDGIARVEEK